MTATRFTLTDASSGVGEEKIKIDPNDVAGRLQGFEINKRTLRGGLSDGVELVEVRLGDLAFVVVPTRGMGLWKVWTGDFEIGWQSPVRGPVHPKFVPLTEPGGLGWLDGFDELLVRCGLESNGAPDFDDKHRLVYPLHGRIANRPAQQVEVLIDPDQGQISVRGVVEETRFLFTKLRMTSTYTVRAGKSAIWVRDEVENFSGSPAEMQMLYHINFGQPLLDPGSRFIAPLGRLMPRDARAAEGLAAWDVYAPPVAGYAEQVYFMELLADARGDTPALLANAAGDRGVSIHVPKSQLPCFTLWKNTTASSDGYVTGLEPGTNFPNPRSFEGRQGRVVRLAPGGRAAFDLRLALHQNAGEVQSAAEAIAHLQAGVTPEIHDQPQPDWCRLLQL